ncbi:site-specific integrase [Streptomyces sp. NBC_00390]|uniref:tyrosine-type recombinase/integrase n=1 Tax=Streptomyces sp. NBC_00390 TaxID=2975736 RepID=UPI002E1B3D54
MANIVERACKDGTVTFQVRWREGGRGGRQQNEKFGSRPSAEQFKKLVDAHGQQWPRGWVRGHGFAEPETYPDDVPLVEWAYRCVDRLTGVDELTREDYRREIRLHISLARHTLPTGALVPATICNLTADDVRDWIRLEESGLRDPQDPQRWVRKPAHPKSLAKRHGLLHCFVQAAVEAEPQLRTKNCCQNTRLPRVDHLIEEEMTYLERGEYLRVASEIWDPHARDLTDWLVGTGMRWGEATALQVRDLNLNAAVPTASVQRAWKRAATGSGRSFFLGPPKTRKARRVIALSPSLAEIARRRVVGQSAEAFVFRTDLGRPWLHANFYQRRWQPAVEAAVQKGLQKQPRIHDLRHTHVAWLIAAKIPSPAIQARLGHESITTTIDRYGHLLRELDGEISEAVEAAMASASPETGLRLLASG